MNTTEGWIKIHRSITQHWLWGDPLKLYWWLDLLMLANYEDGTQLVGNTLVEVKRGQMLASLGFLSKRWKVSECSVRKYLNLLISDKMLEKNAYPKYNLLTICNYDTYQYSAYPNAYPNVDPNAYPNVYPIKEIKEINNISLTKSARANYNNIKSGAEWAETEKLYEELLEMFQQPTETRKSFMRLTGYTDKELVKLLKKFQTELRATASTSHRTRNDYRKYFLNWVERQKNKNTQNGRAKTNPLHDRGTFDNATLETDF